MTSDSKMMPTGDAIITRIADSQDHAALAEFRWDHKSEDGEIPSHETREAFIKSYCADLGASLRNIDTVHWIAETDGVPVGAMTVRMVDKERSPGKSPGKWGYLTNVYIVAEYRNRRIGTCLLEATIAWAKAVPLELLIVWPSETSQGFYRRAGFAGRDAPFELLLE